MARRVASERAGACVVINAWNDEFKVSMGFIDPEEALEGAEPYIGPWPWVCSCGVTKLGQPTGPVGFSMTAMCFHCPSRVELLPRSPANGQGRDSQ